jgi:hypothetical protein
VTDERLLKINPENLERQKEVEKEVQASKGQTPPSNYTSFLSVMTLMADLLIFRNADLGCYLGYLQTWPHLL